jgi:hypothetical protein
MPAPTCTQFAFKCEYWAGQSLFLPFLLSLFTDLRTRPFTRILLLSFSVPFTSTFRSPLFSSSPYFESSFSFPFSEHIQFPVSSVFYTQRYSNRKSTKLKAEVYFSAKSQYLSIQMAKLNKNTNVSRLCFQAWRVISVCVARIWHTHSEPFYFPVRSSCFVVELY